jgi:hypothetical protein
MRRRRPGKETVAAAKAMKTAPHRSPRSSKRWRGAAVGSALWIGTAAGQQVFQPTAKEADLYIRIRDHAQQQRVQVVLDPRLCSAARKHAADTQARRFFAHVNPDGVNSNRRVLNEGYPLPSSYGADQNYVESMAGSVVDTPADAVKLWTGSSAHANHVFGKTTFYRGQVVFGVGHAAPLRWGYATYVFISAPPPQGQAWSMSSSQAAKTMVTADSAGILRVSGPHPQAILEVWKSSTLQNWSLDRTIVMDADGKMPVGVTSGPEAFFRIGYFQP